MSLREYAEALAACHDAYGVLYSADVAAASVNGKRAKTAYELSEYRNLKKLLFSHKMHLMLLECKANNYGVNC